MKAMKYTPSAEVDPIIGPCYDRGQAGFMDRRKQTGQYGEDLAAALLSEKGYQVIERNWRRPTGELDLVAQDNDTLVFVEVRTRSGARFGRAEESITPAKQVKLVELAQLYMQEKELTTHRWRIDVVAVHLGRGTPEVNHIENAVGW